MAIDCVLAIRQTFRTKHILKSSYLNWCGLFFVGDFMAIQTINLTVPGGDTPRSANTKINANFSNTAHAASCLLGTAAGQVPLAQDTFKAAYSFVTDLGSDPSNDFDNLASPSLVLIGITGVNAPLDSSGETHWVVQTIPTYITRKMQIAYGLTTGRISIRTYSNGTWTAWSTSSTSKLTYDTTTALGANVVVDSTGKLMRSTSSERYKDILAPLELDDARYADAMALKPIVYRSTADADNPAYHYYSFSAEELGAYDPAFTLWRETETVTDADGNVSEQPLAERQAEGININALLAMSHAIAIKQDKFIKELQAQVKSLQSAVVTQQATNNP